MKVVEVKWNDSLSIPIYVLEDGREFMPMTGQFAGYYEEVNKESVNKKYGINQGGQDSE